MARTRTSGITVDSQGNRTINKQVFGKNVFRRLGKVPQEAAECQLSRHAERVRLEIEKGCRPRITFREAARRFLIDSEAISSVETVAYHIERLDLWIGNLPLDDVCDETLASFQKARRDDDMVSQTTINRSLEVVRRILNLAARSWRHPNRMTWLETAPLISIRKNRNARKPYPLSWKEQTLFFSELRNNPNGQMALFKVNTGMRESEVCGLRWDWEVQIPELGTSVFVIPGDFVKNREDRLVVLNEVARSVVEARRGIDGDFVFGFRGRRLACMNNTAWQSARKRAAARYPTEFGRPAPWGFENVRVHDLKHTFGRRLRAAGVPEETRKLLLGHRDGSITTHYSAAELAELIAAANSIDASRETPAITLIRSPEVGRSLAKVERKQKGLAELSTNPLI